MIEPKIDKRKKNGQSSEGVRNQGRRLRKKREREREAKRAGEKAPQASEEDKLG